MPSSIISKSLVHNGRTAVTLAPSTLQDFTDCREASYAMVAADCVSGSTSCVWSAYLLSKTDAILNPAPTLFIDVDESFPPDPTAGLHTSLTGRTLYRLFDVRGIDGINIRLNTVTAADEVFNCLIVLVR
jgi:hypothetical protein